MQCDEKSQPAVKDIGSPRSKCCEDESISLRQGVSGRSEALRPKIDHRARFFALPYMTKFYYVFECSDRKSGSLLPVRTAASREEVSEPISSSSRPSGTRTQGRYDVGCC